MNRRALLARLGAISTVVWPLTARAQPGRGKPLIAFLAGGTQSNAARLIGFLMEGLRELEYVEGRNMTSAGRFAEGHPERLPGLAAELVQLKPAVLVANAVDAAVVLKKATGTIPIVSPLLADAVHLGLIASDARPGGNVTGITPYVAGLPAKQLEIAREVVPGARTIGILGNLNDPKAPAQRQELEEAIRRAGLKAVAPEVGGPDNIVDAMQSMVRDKVDVVVVLQTSMLVSERRQVSAFAAAKSIPAVYGYREHVDDGGLISYGINMRWCFHRAAVFVHKILNGAAPGDLPVEFPTTLEMVINLKTASALGIVLPVTLLARANEVIE